MNSLFYNSRYTFEENFERGPVELLRLRKPTFEEIKPNFEFLGFPLNTPFGIAAGPLLHSKYIKTAFDFGFSICTYKTVRSQSFPCHPFPNIVFVETGNKLDPLKTKQLKIKSGSFSFNKISITNSFGVPSMSPDFWQKDVRKSLKYEKSGQLLILAFMGTVKKNQTESEFIKDFVKTARLAKQTGVKVLEVNLSCPNLGNEGLVCYDLKITEKICNAIRKEISNTPLIIKIGFFNKDKDIEVIARIANDYANAIAAINTIQAEIVDKFGNQALPGPNRLRSGVGGHAIKWAGLEMTSKLNGIRKRKNYKYEILGIGGVMTSSDYFDYRKAGADAVLSATGAMWNPYLAEEIWRKEMS